MAKNKQQLIEEAIKYINESEMNKDEKKQSKEALNTLTKQEIKEYLDNSTEEPVNTNQTKPNLKETLKPTPPDEHAPDITPTQEEPDAVLETITKPKPKRKRRLKKCEQGHFNYEKATKCRRVRCKSTTFTFLDGKK